MLISDPYIADVIRKWIDLQPTIIDLQTLDKIRAEIANLDDADYDFEGYYKAVRDVMEIIDEYKAESEE